MLTIIISTCNERIRKLSLPAKKEGVKYIVIHQVFGKYDDGTHYKTNSLTRESLIERNDVNIVLTRSVGLSKSRNLGLNLCRTKFAQIMDDDVKIDVCEIQRMVSWMHNTEVDIATGIHAFERKGVSSHRNSPFEHNALSIFKVSSIDICMNVDSIKKNNIEFDENFGLGTKFPSGEELIFLSDCLRENLKVFFFPACIGVHPDNTSGEDFYSSVDKILAKRQMMIRAFNKLSFFFIFSFWLKKSRVALTKGCFFKFSKYLFFGN